MAEGFANRYGSDVLVARSAGLAAVQLVARETVEIMREINIDISNHVPTPYDPVTALSFDIVVNMSGFRLPGKPPRQVLEWKVEDPFQRPKTVYERVRGDLEQKVMQLILRLRKLQGQ
jgi:arsenate reductase